MKAAKLIQQNEWEAIYSGDSIRSKNLYPSEEVVSFVMRRFGQVRDKAAINVLDVGCGWGNNLSFLKGQGFSYTGLDFSAIAVKHCRQYHANVICANLTEIPLPDGEFDLVIDRMAIQHNGLEEIKQIFAEVWRVLKPGGLFHSSFIAEGKMPVLTTFLGEEELRHLARKFSNATVDYTVHTENNQKDLFKTNILVATK